MDNDSLQLHANDASAECIHRRGLRRIDNSSASDGGYGDYTSLSTDLALGMPHAFTLEPGYSSFAFNEWFREFLDRPRPGR